MTRRGTTAAARAVALTLAACTGAIGDPPLPELLGPGGREGEGEAAPAVFAPAPPTLHRLTAAQVRNSLRDLLGDVPLTTELETDTVLHGFSSVGASEIAISPRAVEQYEALALEVTESIFADEARRAALVGCAPAASADPCLRGFLGGLARRAWRRPIAAEEADTLAELARALGDLFSDPWQGARWATAAILQSPHFLFRVEQGEPDPDSPGRLRLTGHELAARLSYLLWDTTPDDELLDAAARGELDDADRVRAQVARLWASPRARAAVRRFFDEYFHLDRLAGVTKDATLFPQWTPALAEAARAEVGGIVEDLVFERDADLRRILDTRRTFVNAELAALYGLPAPAGGGFAPVELPADGPRAGLLGTAAILALYAHTTVTSPTLRGKFVRVELLCEDIPPPPPGAVTELPPPQGNETVRQRLERHRSDPVCASCHNRMDPLGLGLEDFDPIGAFRTTDNGAPVDARSELAGTAFSGARELGALLRAEPGFAACLARKLYRHATGHLELASEQPAIDRLAARFAQDGHRFGALLAELLAADEYRQLAPPEAPEGEPAAGDAAAGAGDPGAEGTP